MALKLVLSHHLLKSYRVSSNDGPVVALDFFYRRVIFASSYKSAVRVELFEIIVDFGIKLSITVHIMGTCSYMNSRCQSHSLSKFDKISHIDTFQKSPAPG